jgi:hypothetical protein
LIPWFYGGGSEPQAPPAGTKKVTNGLIKQLRSGGVNTLRLSKSFRSWKTFELLASRAELEGPGMLSTAMVSLTTP